MKTLCIERGAALVLSRLHQAGYPAYVVGGCVRDALLGRTPNDWDICSGATPQQTLALFGEENCIPTGLKHGTITVKMDGGLYEVTTFRTEGTYSDGRHPDSVAFVGDVREDLSRRDFTINAMAYNDEEGLVDPFGGREDLLKRRVVRAVGVPGARFGEDALRILRLFRFAARFSLAIEEETLLAAKALAANLARVSPERIREELFKTLMSERPAAYLPYDVLVLVMPALAAVKTEYDRALAAVDALPAREALRLAAFFYPMGEAQARNMMRALRASNRQTDDVCILLRMAQAPAIEDRTDLTEYALRCLGAYGLDAVREAELLAAAAGTQEAARLTALTARLACEAQAQGRCCRMAELAVRGEDVMRIVGGGAVVGRTMDRLLRAVLRGELANEREALLRAAHEMNA